MPLAVLGAGMGLCKSVFQTLSTDMGIDLRRLQGGMAQQLLHHAQIRPAVEDVGGRGMP